MACTSGETCSSLRTRMLDTDYPKTIFEYRNLITFFGVLILLVIARYAYSASYYFLDRRDRAKQRLARSELRRLRQHVQRERGQRTSSSCCGRRSAVAVAPSSTSDDESDKWAALAADVGQGKVTARRGDAYGLSEENAAAAAAAAAGSGEEGTPGSKDPQSWAKAIHAAEEQGLIAPTSRDGRPVMLQGIFGSLDAQLIYGDNPAVAYSYTALSLAVCLVLSGPRSPSVSGPDTTEGVMDLILWTIIGLVLLTASAGINDFVLLHRFSVREAIVNKNTAAGIAESGSLLAAGLLVRVQLSGYEQDTAFSVDLSLVCIYWLLAQATFLASALLLQCFSGYDMQGAIKDNNIAAGIHLAGNQIAIATIIIGPLSRSDALLLFAAYVFPAAIALLIIRLVIFRFILPFESGRTEAKEIGEDGNWGVALISTALSIAMAMALTSTLPEIGCPSTVA